VEGSEEVLPCNLIIEAIGQMPDLDFMAAKGMPVLPITRWNTLDASEQTLQTDLPYVFTGGDCFTGPGLMIEAIGAGRFAARSIHFYMMEGKIPSIEQRQTELISDSIYDSVVGIVPKPKVHLPMVTLEDRLGTFKEVEGTIDEEDSHYEAKRCLNCGTYCYDMDLEAEEDVGEESA
jgi:NADPH-dependent glutamate synthase beta subunit-like oxidoreductase